MTINKTAFTSRDLETAFGMSNREQVYFVDRGYLVPDIQADRPRVYSLYSAMKAGALQFFERHGYKLDRANRLAEIFVTTQSTFQDYPQCTIEVVNGTYGFVYTEEDNRERKQLLAFDILSDSGQINTPGMHGEMFSTYTLLTRTLCKSIRSKLSIEEILHEHTH